MLVFLVGAGVTMLCLAAITFIGPLPTRNAPPPPNSPAPSQATQSALETNAARPTRGPLVTQPPSPTNTLVVKSPTPGPSPSPRATATWFYVVPAQPTPIPTPVLPPAAPFPASCDGPGRMNILLIGIDGFVGSYDRAARADTIVIVGVNFAEKNAQMLSIPRDLWVQLPGLVQQPEDRINTAYHYGEFYAVPGGGPAELAATVSATFGLRIDRYVVVNFLAFEQGIDAIGGIDLNIARPLHDSAYPLRDGSGTIAIDFPAGWVHLDGSAALIYARIRHDSTDFQRMRRQQQVLFAVRDRLLSADTLPQLPALAQTLIGAARTNLTFDDIALLGCLAPQISRDAIQAWVVDSTMTQDQRLPDGAQVLLPKMDAILPILQAFNSGQ